MLTITDVTTKRFSEARVYEGYEMTEVDRFMAEVAEAFYERDKQIADLQERLAAAARSQVAFEASTFSNGQGNGSTPASTSTPHVAGEVLPQETAAHDLCESAVRVLEIASANADQLVREAKIEAGALLTAAHAAADQLNASSRDEAARVSAELAQQQKRQETELQEYRSTVLAGLAEQKAALERRINELQKLEGEHLSELHSYFTEQLAQVQLRSSSAGVKLSPTGAHAVDASG